MKLLAGFLAVGFLAAAAATASAETLRVPSDAFPTVQSAVDAAGEGDVIRIASGESVGPTIISGKFNLTLRGEGEFVGIDTGAFDMEPSLRIVGGKNIVLRNLRVRVVAPDPYPVGIDATGVKNLRILGVRVDGGGGGLGIRTTDCKGVVIAGCAFSETDDGILDDSSHEVTIKRCRFFDVIEIPINLSPGAAPGDGSDWAVVSGNRRSGDMGNLGTGIRIVGHGARIERNDIYQTNDPYFGGDGEAVEVIGDLAVVRRNLFRVGIVRIVGNDALVERNESTTGIVVIGFGGTVRRNRILGFRTKIHVEGIAFNIERNVIGGWDDGIYVDAPFTVVRGNRAHHYRGPRVFSLSGVGLQIVSNSVTVIDNDITHCGIRDLADAQPAGVNVYERNRFGTTAFDYVP